MATERQSPGFPAYLEREAYEDLQQPANIAKQIIHKARREDVMKAERDDEYISFIDPSHQYFVIEKIDASPRTPEELQEQEEFKTNHRGHDKWTTEVYSFPTEEAAKEFAYEISTQPPVLYQPPSMPGRATFEAAAFDINGQLLSP